MKSFILYLLMVFAWFGHMNANAQEIDPVFDKLVGVARVIVITGNRDESLADLEIGELRGALDGLAERQIAVLRFREDDLYEVEGLSDYNYGGWYRMDAAEQRYMEEKLQTDNNIFSVVLVGLDGQVKKVWLEPVEPQVIFDLIDEMPMRAEEMKASAEKKKEKTSSMSRYR